MVSHFQQAVDKGEKAEAILDTYFSQWYQINRVSNQEQNQGFDRRFQNEKGIVRTIEYKMDQRAQQTGNLFAEIWHVNDEGKAWEGWAIRSQADWLVLYIPTINDFSQGVCYWVKMSAFKVALPQWMCQHRIQTIKTPGKTWKYPVPFTTTAVLVPVKQVEAIASRKYEIG